jgi:hypothetical protein
VLLLATAFAATAPSDATASVATVTARQTRATTEGYADRRFDSSKA